MLGGLGGDGAGVSMSNAAGKQHVYSLCMVSNAAIILNQCGQTGCPSQSLLDSDRCLVMSAWGGQMSRYLIKAGGRTNIGWVFFLIYILIQV